MELKEIISAGKHFPICKCGRRMDWIEMRFGKFKSPLDYAVCLKCDRVSLTRVSANGEVTTLRLQPNGAFSLE